MNRQPNRAVWVVLAVALWSPAMCRAQEHLGITQVPGVKVGHHTLTERMTGCTVVLVEEGAVAGVDVRGAAPATRETDLLSPGNTVERVHAVVFAGGSAFGLDAASGAVRFLEEKGVGFDVGGLGVVPIVPAAALFDLGVGGDATVRPDAVCGYRAASSATAGPVAEGSVGAGAGATVGKIARGRAMKSGIGTAAIELPNGLIVGAIAAVNAVGDIIDPDTGEIVAGALNEDMRSFVNQAASIRRGELGGRGFGGRNTTLALIATNAALTKSQATRVAEVAHDGLARSISPVHTPMDGDIVFALSVGTREGSPDMLVVGALAADVAVQAVLRAVQTAVGLPGLPSITDLQGR